MTRNAVEAAFAVAGDNSKLSVWTSPDTDDLVVAAYPSKVTFRFDPRWCGYLLVQQARMIIRFSPNNAEMEIRVRRPYTGALLAMLFLAVGAWGVTQTVRESLASGSGVLLVGLPFLAIGVAPAIAFCYRLRHVRREIALLRNAWAQWCEKRTTQRCP